MNKVVIVNEADEPIGFKAYWDIHHSDIYRVSAVWITDTSTGDVLMTQRKWTKHNDPGKWMAAASGTIEEGETYDENIVHEIEEEIGLRGLQLEKGPKGFTDDGKHKFFVQWYLATVSKEKLVIRIQEDEVEAYAWVPLRELIKELAAMPEKFVPSLEKDMKTLRLI